MKYDGILLCSDFDGTLAVEATISEENIDAIKMFQTNGGKFTLATGRSPAFVANKFSDISFNAPLISLNGAAIYDLKADKMLSMACLDDPSAFVIDIFTNEKCYQVNIFNKDFSEHFIKKSEPDCVERLAKCLVADYILKIVFIFEDTDTPVVLANKFRPLYSDKFYFARSWGYSLEVNSTNGTKGAALQKIKSLLPDVTTTVGVGDFDNDLSLVECADIGYAVANASDEVKSVANRITVSCKEHAIAKIIYEL